MSKFKRKILIVVGARPNFVKVAPLINEFKKHKDVELVLVHTGQHYDPGMSDVFFSELNITKPDYNLGVGSASHALQTARIMKKIESVIIKENPALVIVIGDVNSSLAGALVAKKLGVPLAHLEAGPRLGSKTNPEEINRIVIDHISDLLFCPSEESVSNLKKEGIDKGVYNVGDIMLDTFIMSQKIFSNKTEILNKLGLKPKNYFFVTIHRAENTNNKKRMENILKALEKMENVVFICHPRTEKFLKKYNLWEKARQKIKIIKPLGYIDTIFLEKNAKKIITDSGGIQKEAYWCRVPCITLMENSAWPEIVMAGWNFLAGADKDKILWAADNFIPAGKYKNYFGNGKTAEKIFKIILANT